MTRWQLVFLSTKKNASFFRFHCKASRKTPGSSKILKTALQLRDRHIFTWLSLEVFNIFNGLTFLKNEKCFGKTGLPLFSWKRYYLKRRKYCAQKKSCNLRWRLRNFLGKKLRALIVAQHLLKEKSHSFNVVQKIFVN